jgi:hypothetical protein
VSKGFGRPRRTSAPADQTPLDAIIRDMRELRLTLASDLSTAAGATEDGAYDVAGDIVDGDRADVARFARLIDERLRRVERFPTAPAPRPTSSPAWRRRIAVALPIAPVVGALALSAAAATGALPLPGQSHSPAPAVNALANGRLPSSFTQLVKVVHNDPSASQVIAAATKLHRQLTQLIARSSNDPQSVAEVAQLLQLEQSLLLKAQPPGASVVLNQNRRLAARLVTLEPSATPSLRPTDLPTVAPSHAPARHRSDTTRTTTTKASPKPSPSEQHRSPSPSPSPSGSPSSNPIPGVPG